VNKLTSHTIRKIIDGEFNPTHDFSKIVFLVHYATLCDFDEMYM